MMNASMEILNNHSSEVYIINMVGRERREWKTERSCRKLEIYPLFRPCDEDGNSTAERWNEGNYLMLKIIYHNNNYLINGLFVFGVVIFIIGSIILHIIFGDHVPQTYWIILMLLADICLMTSSVFIIIRKEAPKPGFQGPKGTVAVVIGVISLIFWGSIAVAMIIFLFNPSAF
jgi:hypothetical protein